MATETGTATAPRVQLHRVFSAPPERVFRAWTTPEELKRWHAPPPLTCIFAEVDLRIGGRFRIGMRAPDGTEHWVGGVFRVIEPPRKLSCTWRWEKVSGNNDTEESLLTVEFLPRNPGTELVLTHEGLTNPEYRSSHEHGWAGILDRFVADLAARG